MELLAPGMELLARMTILPTVVGAPRHIGALALNIRELIPTSVRAIPLARLEAARANALPSEEQVPIRRDRPITSRPPPVRRLSDSCLVTRNFPPSSAADTANARPRLLQRPLPIFRSRRTPRCGGAIEAANWNMREPVNVLSFASSRRSGFRGLDSLIS